MATALSAAWLALPLLAPQAAFALTQSAIFDPVLIVDGEDGSTGFTFSGFTSTVSGVTTTISLTKCGGKINSSTGVCEGLGFSFNDEIRLRLQSPTGTIVSLVPFGALTGQQPGDTVTWGFTDTALSMVSGSLLVSNTYRPASPLSVFNGEDGNGTWSLLFRDDFPEDPLSINSWSLTVNAGADPGPGPTPADVPGPLPL